MHEEMSDSNGTQLPTPPSSSSGHDMLMHNGIMHRVLVAGGAGFLGSHLVDALIAANHEVIVLDSFLTGDPKNLAHLKDHPKLTLIRHDIIESLPNDLYVDRIYHLACAASPPQYQRDPVHTLRTCFVGTENLLNLANKCSARILLASTSEIYGDPEQNPQPESYHGNVNSFGPRSCYDEGKRVAEALFYAYSHDMDARLSIRIARIFNTYGPRMSGADGRVVSNFIHAALKGEPLQIYGDGGATRSLQYVSDCVDGLMRLMESEYDNGPVNLGSSDERTMRELADFILAAVQDQRPTRRQSVVEFQDRPEDDPRKRRADNALAKKILGWSPRVSLEEGVRRTIEWFRGELKQN